MARRVLLLGLAAGAAAQKFVTVVKDASGTWWFQQNGNRYLQFTANHVNDGGADDGVGGRESPICQAAGFPNCGDTLNFAGQLGYAPYFNVTQDKYGNNATAWAEASVARLQSWGFIGVSGWSNRLAEEAAARHGLVYNHLLDMGTTWPHSATAYDWDLWSANFSDQCEQIAAKEVAPRANDTALALWQTDNEPNWSASGFQRYLVDYRASEGGAVALAWLQARYSSLAALNAAWGTNAPSWAALYQSLPAPNQAAFTADQDDWLGVASDRYHNVTTSAIRRYDSNHLISGVRFAGNSPQIVAAAGKYVDVIDQHDYADLPGVQWLAQIHNITGRPVILGEFSFTAADSNLPNTHGARAHNPEPTQTRRAWMYDAYSRLLLTQPYVVGYGWWNWPDEPATGRWPDGEDSNYGLVTLADDAYTILTAHMTANHAAAAQWHAAGVAPCGPGSPGARNLTLVPLHDYFSSDRVDHYADVDCEQCFDDYADWGVIGYAFANCVEGAVPLDLWWNAALGGDNALLLTTAPPQGGSGYTLIRTVAYAWPAPGAGVPAPPAGLPALTPLHAYLATNATSGKLDYRAVTPATAANATAGGYVDLGVLAQVFAAPASGVEPEL